MAPILIPGQNTCSGTCMALDWALKCQTLKSCTTCAKTHHWWVWSCSNNCYAWFGHVSMAKVPSKDIWRTSCIPCMDVNVMLSQWCLMSSTLLGWVEDLTHLGWVMDLDSCWVHLMHFASLRVITHIGLNKSELDHSTGFNPYGPMVWQISPCYLVLHTSFHVMWVSGDKGHDLPI